MRQSLKGQARRHQAARRRLQPRQRRREEGNGKAKKPAAGQREMLFALEGKGQKTAAKADTKRETAKRPARATTRQKRAG